MMILNADKLEAFVKDELVKAYEFYQLDPAFALVKVLNFIRENRKLDTESRVDKMIVDSLSGSSADEVYGKEYTKVVTNKGVSYIKTEV